MPASIHARALAPTVFSSHDRQSLEPSHLRKLVFQNAFTTIIRLFLNTQHTFKLPFDNAPRLAVRPSRGDIEGIVTELGPSANQFSTPVPAPAQ